MQNLYIGRKVALASALCSLILGLLPIVANADWRSTAGIVAAIGGLALVAQKWLDGLQKHEAREATPATNVYSHARLLEQVRAQQEQARALGMNVQLTGQDAATVDPEFTPDPDPPSGPDLTAADSALDGGQS